MTDQDPLDPLGKIRDLEDRIIEIVNDLNMELDNFSVSLDPKDTEGEPEVVILRLKVDHEALKTPEEKEIDQIFEDIVKGL